MYTKNDLKKAYEAARFSPNTSFEMYWENMQKKQKKVETAFKNLVNPACECDHEYVTIEKAFGKFKECRNCNSTKPA